MISFKDIELSDKEWIQRCLDESDFKGCEYSFGNNFIWGTGSNIKIANLYGCYLVKWGTEEPKFLYPAGGGDVKRCIQDVIAYCEEMGFKLRFYDVPAVAAEKLQEMFPNEFDYELDRDSFDYIYNSKDLIELKGKKYHSKRNFINRILPLNWSFEKISPDNIKECIEMNKEWCKANNCAEDDEKNQEACAVRRALENFSALGFSGGLIRLDGKVVAFSIGERLSSDTFVVHIEKAFSDIPGAYPLINREFVKHFAADYKYVNREDDVGIEGLRKAKLSYNPVLLYEKYTVTKR